MATVAEALQELSITEWVLRGEPTKEEEFKEMCRTGTFVCPYCKSFSHKAIGGKTWNVHWGKWIQS